jgi:teichuronic acid biosynthesis glycosyltransferase TuaC
MRRESLFTFPIAFHGPIMTCKEKKPTANVPAGDEVLLNLTDPVPGWKSETKSNLSDMTLLVITPDYPDRNNNYIGSIFVKNQLDSLKGYFRKIIVIAPVFYSGGLLPNDRTCQNYHYDNIDVYYPRCLFFPRRVVVPLIKNSYKFSFDTRLSAVLRLIQREHLEFDLIHAHFTWPSASIAATLKKTFHVPVVATIHEDSGWLEEEIAMNNARLISAWQNADALIRVNREELPLLKKFNPNVFFVPNGFPVQFQPLDKAECRSRLGINPGTKVIISLGDLIERKGFGYLVDAMAKIRARRDDVICVIGGKGPEEKNLIRKIHENNLDDCVRLAGFIPGPRVPVWMNAADLFVLPSIHESFGIVQIEALACGTPVISTDTVGSREIITSDEIGLFCKPADAVSLDDAITRGLEKSWDIQKILKYSKQFSWDTVVTSIIPIYSQVIRTGNHHE